MISKEKKKKLLKEIETSIDWKKTDYELIGCKVFFKNLSHEERNTATVLALDISDNTVDDLINNTDEEIEDKKEPIKKEDVGEELSKDKKEDKKEKKQGFSNPNLFSIAMDIYIAIESIYLENNNGKKEKVFDESDFDELKIVSPTSKMWEIIKEANEYNQNTIKKK